MVIAKFATEWAGLVSYVSANTIFNKAVDAIKTDAELQANILKGYAKTKKEKKFTMATAASIVCRKVQAYATGIKDKTLFTNMDISFSKLYYGGSNKGITLSKNILAAVNAILPAEQVKYGITPAEITALTDAIDDFATFTATPRAQIVGRANSTKKLKENFKTATDTLTTNLDKLMSNFQPGDFYNEYFMGRRIVDLQRHTVIEGNVTDENGNDLNKVKVTIIAKNKTTNEQVAVFEEKTDKNGNYAKSEINPELDYDMVFELPNYETKTISDVDITRGEHELVDVKLVKIIL